MRASSSRLALARILLAGILLAPVASNGCSAPPTEPTGAADAWSPAAPKFATPRTATPAAWLVPAWYIDPMSILATCSDGNTGTSAAAPLCTWHQLNDSRWGCQGDVDCPRLPQVTTVTWESPAPISDMVYAHPALESGASLVLTAPLPHPRCTGTLSGVVQIDRTIPQLTNAALCAGAAVGDLVVDTTHPSRAKVFANVTGNTWALSSPQAPTVVPPVAFVMPSNVAFANGDAYADYPPFPSVFMADVRTVVGVQNSVTTSAGVILYQLTIGSTLSASDHLRVNEGFSAYDCTFNRAVDFEHEGGQYYSWLTGNWFAAGVSGGHPSVYPAGATEPLNFNGGIIGTPGVFSPIHISSGVLDNDLIMTGTPAGDDGCKNTPMMQASSLEYGSFYIDASMRLIGDREWSAGHSSGSGTHVIWGPGGWDILNNGHLYYQSGAAATTFLNKGVMHLNCGAAACNGNSTTLPSACGITISESTIASNGTLWVPGGASVGPTP